MPIAISPLNQINPSSQPQAQKQHDNPDDIAFASAILLKLGGPSMTLSQLIQSAATIEKISDHLDQLDAAERQNQTLALNGSLQQELYSIAAQASAIDLAHFVPDDIQDGREVIHFGRNSQPAFRFFQKRWCRPTGAPDELWGYNEAGVRPLIGPGYFVAHPTAEGGSDPRGAIVVDYFKLPEGPMPGGWPKIKPNSSGLQMFVYNKTRDYMRRVSAHVSIGVAFRMEKRIMGYFVLCREESP
jgi:hypothetical protein